MFGGIAIVTLLVAVNAKYIHTNPAVRSIAAYAHAQFDLPLDFAEFTINQRHNEVVRALYEAGADCYLFSCYIWNIGYIKLLVSDLAKLLPQAKIVLGGPEAGWQARELLAAMPQVHAVIVGEGERSAGLLLQALEQDSVLAGCPGIAFRTDGKIAQTEPPAPLDLAGLPFAYTDLVALAGRIPYYESMRGCPFRCSYCLSAADRGVRYRPLEKVFAELQIFLDAGVRQVKFVDRTFNCHPQRAMEIWRYLADHDNGVTNFHFEMAGDLLDDEALTFLATVRPGLFQFEIGVQSTHAPTLAAIRRKCDFQKLAATVQRLQAGRNIHLHLDLIAGLPCEDFARFARSFDDVYALEPQQLQLGFLKLLGGSALRREAPQHGIIYQDKAPYEVLYTRWLSYRELGVLHGVDDMVDSFYNSGRFRHLLAYIVAYFSSPFACYRALWECFSRYRQGAPLSKIGYYELLGAFMQEQSIPLTEHVQWLCRYDLALHEKPRKLPSWVTVSLFAQNRSWLGALLRQIGAQIHLEVFPFCPPGGDGGECLVAFHYSKRDITGRAAVQTYRLPLCEEDIGRITKKE